MELKQTVSELEIANDINQLSLQQLREKYLKDEKSFDSFVETYGRFFINGFMYQLRIRDKYDTIYALFQEGTEKYQSEKNILAKDKVKNAMDVTIKNYRVSNANPNDIYESIALFYQSIGANKPKGHVTYEKIVEGMSKSGRIYEENKESSVRDFFAYMNDRLKRKMKDRDDLEVMIEEYMENHPLSELCNDISYLYFVNYMVTHRPSRIDGKFVNDAKEIIEMSRVLQAVDKNDKKEDENYNKVANYTLKVIDKYDKKHKKQETTGKRLIKQVFTQPSHK